SLPHVAERQTVPNSAILVHLAGFQIAFSHIRPAGRIYMRRPWKNGSVLIWTLLLGALVGLVIGGRAINHKTVVIHANDRTRNTAEAVFSFPTLLQEHIPVSNVSMRPNDPFLPEKTHRIFCRVRDDIPAKIAIRGNLDTAADPTKDIFFVIGRYVRERFVFIKENNGISNLKNKRLGFSPLFVSVGIPT
ncbi:MAG: hypothetical protein WA532_03975, partial [Candidatus Korobacteraceae bacterium]